MRTLLGNAVVPLALMQVVAACAGPSGKTDAEKLSQWTEPRSGLQFLPVAGGAFLFGCEPGDSACEPDEKPSRNARVKPFWFGKTETTVAAYDKCVKDGACTPPVARAEWPNISEQDRARLTPMCNYGVAGKEQHPMNCLELREAEQFCGWIGGRLPTAIEWEYAAKAGEHRLYAWGDAPPTADRANFCDRQCKRVLPELVEAHGELHKLVIGDVDDGWATTAPVGSYSAGVGKFGMLDMTGNVSEWVATPYDRQHAEIRGGSWCRGEPKLLRNSARWSRIDSRAPDAGFRCAFARLP